MLRSRKILLITAALIVSVIPTISYATDIVFDPTNYGKAVEQARQQAQMVRQLEEQIKNQLKMLQNWGFSQLGGIMQSMNQWQASLTASTYSTTDPTSQLNSQFPATPQDYTDMTDAAMREKRDQWQHAQRDAVIENRTVQNRVAQDLQPTAERVNQYVQQSSAAPGPTAAVQAGNEELATVIAQVQALQALEITSARTEVQLTAEEQSEAAYHAAEAQRVMANFYSPPRPTGQVARMFDQE